MATSRLHQYIESLDLDDDGTYRGNCPVCAGRNTFTATKRDGDIMYNCYKNSCNIAGKVHTGMSVDTIKRKLSSGSDTTDREFNEAANDRFQIPEYITHELARSAVLHKFLVKWNINPDQILFDVRQDRVVFPVYSHKNVLVDAVGRALDPAVQPKWLRYHLSPVPYMMGKSRVGVIVEDVISAYTVNDIIPSATGVALLGTQLTNYHKWYLPQLFDTLIVALDPDAMSKTLSIAKELRGLVTNVKALKIFDDLKYANDDDIYNLRALVMEASACH
jgi:hypothetical protein